MHVFEFVTGQEPLKFSRDLASDWVVQNEPGLPKPGKIISIAGIARRLIISQEA